MTPSDDHFKWTSLGSWRGFASRLDGIFLGRQRTDTQWLGMMKINEITRAWNHQLLTSSHEEDHLVCHPLPTERKTVISASRIGWRWKVEGMEEWKLVLNLFFTHPNHEEVCVLSWRGRKTWPFIIIERKNEDDPHHPGGSRDDGRARRKEEEPQDEVVLRLSGIQAPCMSCRRFDCRWLLSYPSNK